VQLTITSGMMNKGVFRMAETISSWIGYAIAIFVLGIIFIFIPFQIIRALILWLLEFRKPKHLRVWNKPNPKPRKKKRSYDTYGDSGGSSWFGGWGSGDSSGGDSGGDGGGGGGD
jgi:uncharacterized membrane protein YgcG